MAGAGNNAGIEIPVVLNADGTVKGLSAIARGIDDIKSAATGASDALDAVGNKSGMSGPAAGPKPKGADDGNAPERASWWATKTGQSIQGIASAGLSFIERNLPNLFDPTKSRLEKGMEAAPLAARSAAQLSAGAALGALETKLAGTGIEIPETLKQQIIHTAGVAAEEAAKAAFRELKTMIETARSGAEQQLAPFAAIGVMPDEGTLHEILNSYAQLGKRQFALQKMIGEGINSMGLADESVMKQLNGTSAPDSGAMIERLRGDPAISKAVGGN
jgi:hypothetical protein